MFPSHMLYREQNHKFWGDWHKIQMIMEVQSAKDTREATVPLLLNTLNYLLCKLHSQNALMKFLFTNYWVKLAYVWDQQCVTWFYDIIITNYLKAT